MAEDNTTPDEQEMVEVDPFLTLVESVFMVLSSALPLIPLQVEQHNIQHRQAVLNIQTGIHTLGNLAMALGSTIVRPTEAHTEEPPPPPSGIILPK